MSAKRRRTRGKRRVQTKTRAPARKKPANDAPRPRARAASRTFGAWSDTADRAGLHHLRAAFARVLGAGPQTLGGNVLNVRPDPGDTRDHIYEPSLVEIRAVLDAPKVKPDAVRQQGSEGSCTGQALAAVIDVENRRRRTELTARKLPVTNVPRAVSARMLYEMARAYDEYPDDDLPGSSVRGAIKGFFHNGVCSETLAAYVPNQTGWQLTVERARAARATSLGAYFRLRHVLYDYHAALNEVGALVVSAMVHDGWESPGKDGRITLAAEPTLQGAHAFAIVGYDADGFLVLNSWGADWATYARRPGVAHWSYDDWKRHVLDAWVLRLAVPSPKTFHLVGGHRVAPTSDESTTPTRRGPSRIEINGHYIHVDDGQLVRQGKYWNEERSFQETARRLIESSRRGRHRYEHLLLYAHGGLTDLESAAGTAADLTPILKAHGIYPVFFLWRTGFFEEVKDVLIGHDRRIRARARGLTDLTDKLLETVARRIVRPLWTEMKDDAARAMGRVGGGAAWEATTVLARASVRAGMKIHLVGHSAGAIFLGQLLARAASERAGFRKQIASVSLLAPACRVDFFRRTYGPTARALANAGTPVAVYVLSDERERDDSAGPYRKSVLYLVSNALEKEKGAPILGLELTARAVAGQRATAAQTPIDLVVANGTEPRTTAKRHTTVDRDPTTLNDILARVLGRPPTSPRFE